jgi:hypothetical protein
MGQYYLIVNLDKKQFLHRHKRCDSLKLLELELNDRAELRSNLYG